MRTQKQKACGDCKLWTMPVTLLHSQQGKGVQRARRERHERECGGWGHPRRESLWAGSTPQGQALLQVLCKSNLFNLYDNLKTQSYVPILWIMKTEVWKG